MQLLLLPGMDGTGQLFTPLLTALPPTLSAVAFSYPPDEPLGYEELLPLIESAAPHGNFVVVGESFSGPLALMLAARRPQGLRGVVLCASFVQFPLKVPERWRAMLRPWMFRWQPLWLLSWTLLGCHGFGKLGQLLRTAVRSVSPEALAARARAVARLDVTAELRLCPVPILYLQAADDMVVRPRNWEVVQSVRPDATLKVLPGPHLVLQVSPCAAVKELVAFCERVSAAEPSHETER
jgi:pimeloyl-[acyl-carrier protein] methyl ester esterase